jgi:hypothetical protein
MLFFSLLCPQGVNSTNFAGSGNPRSIISLGSREFHIWQRAPCTLVNLVHSVIDFFVLHRRHYLVPRLWKGAAFLCLGSAWGIRDMKKVKVEPAMCTLRWLCRNDVRPTKLHKWHRDIRVFGELAHFQSFTRKLFRNCEWFSNFSILCECCWWKLSVRCKTLIYCRQLCNNAFNYPSTPLRTDIYLQAEIFGVNMSLTEHHLLMLQCL